MPLNHSYEPSLICSKSTIELSTRLDKYELPGLTSYISISDQLSKVEVSGVRKIEKNVKIEESDKFHLGSCTKAMTATLLATFVEDGELKWTDSLSKLFPEIKVNKKLKDIPIQDLLAHRSCLEANPKFS